MTSRDRWRRRLRVNPIPSLLAANNPALPFFAKRDLMDDDPGPHERLWTLREPVSLVSRQQENGSWRYPGGGRPNLRRHEDYDQIETYRSVGFLVEKYALTREHPSMEKAAEFLFSCQTDVGDFRGIYGSQYTPNYSAGIMELLIKAGYRDDERIHLGFRWLRSIRQADGGWAIPLRTRRRTLDAIALCSETLEPDRTRPFSWLVTGVVLRAYAAHERYRESDAAVAASELLAGALLKKDNYPDRGKPEYWTGVSFPFWFTDLVSALDSLSRIGMSRKRPDVGRALEWIKDNQNADGSFAFKLLKTKDKELGKWVTLATCRALKRFA